MASYTPNLNLKKPAGTEDINVADMNGNSDIIDAALVKTNESLTTFNANITAAERARYNRFGKVVIIGLTFTVGTDISGVTDILFTGAPAAQTSTRGILTQADASNGANIRLEVDTSGNIRNAYTSGGIKPGQYEGQIVYVCQ
jgi:hypothetical protein